MLRLAIVTTSAPPSASGQARVLGQLLATAPGQMPASHLFLTDQLNAIEPNGTRLGDYVALATPRFQLVRRLPNRQLQSVNNVAGLLADTVRRSNEIVAAVRRHPVDLVVGCSGNPFDLPAAAIAARRLRLPFVAYLFDDPVYQWERGIYRRFARFCERLWAHGAGVVIAPNEVLVDDVRRRIPSAQLCTVRNPVDRSAFDLDAGLLEDRAPPTRDAPWLLTYTGSVYSAQADAFGNLVAALDRLDGLFKLRVYTSQGDAQVQAGGLVGPHVSRYDHLPQTEALRLQRHSDILVLPLAFDSPIPEVIRSSAPAKVGEYLAARRPVLVHAPQGSFVSELFRRTGSGVVVDRPDVDALVQALRSIGSDAGLRKRLVANAGAAAQEFHIDRARADFSAALERARAN